MPSRPLPLVALVSLVACASISAQPRHAGADSPSGDHVLTSAQPYTAVNGSMPLTISSPERADIELLLMEGDPPELLAVAPIDGAGELDLAEIFPVIWTLRDPRVLYLQARIEGEPTGSALVLRPLLVPAQYTDELSARIQTMLEDNSGNPSALAELSESERVRLRRELAELAPPTTLSGYHVSRDRDLLLRTSMGDMRFRLREDAAPNTSRVIADLAEQGFYEGLTFHRIVQEDAQGHPFFVQGGDPTGTGLGGPGFFLDFEPSNIPHRFGTLSLARRPENPNTGGSQFFICLSREACARFDGLYTAFGELIDGADTLDEIAAAPAGPIDPETPGSPMEKPLVDIVIRSAELVPAAPHGEGPPPLLRTDIKPVGR